MNKLLVFLDESGDPSLDKINIEYPIFGLAGVVIEPNDYLTIVNRFNELKFKYFPHEGIILHSREISSREGDFIFLNNDKERRDFLNDISDVIFKSDYKIVASVIKKDKLKKQYKKPFNPYDLSLIFILEKIFRYACNRGYDYILNIAEARGKEEGEKLHKTFERFKEKDKTGIICVLKRYINEDMLDKIHLRLEFRRKKFNIIGNQIADLIVSPITRTILDGKEHPSFKYFEDKFLYGKDVSLKVFP